MGEDKAYSPGRAVYTRKELKQLSPLRREIARTTNVEWCERWDRVTAAIRKNYGIKEKKNRNKTIIHVKPCKVIPGK